MKKVHKKLIQIEDKYRKDVMDLNLHLSTIDFVLILFLLLLRQEKHITISLIVTTAE